MEMDEQTVGDWKGQSGIHTCDAGSDDQAIAIEI